MWKRWYNLVRSKLGLARPRDAKAPCSGLGALVLALGTAQILLLWGIAVLVTLVGSSCRFQSDQASSSPPIVAAQSNSEEPAPSMYALVSFAASEDPNADPVSIKRLLVPDQVAGSYTVTAPVTVSARVPNVVQFTFVFPSSVPLHSPFHGAAVGSVTGGTSNQVALPVTEVQLATGDVVQNGLSLSLGGLRNLLSDTAEMSAFVAIDLYDQSSEHFLRVNVRINTPPAPPDVLEESVSTYEQRTGTQLVESERFLDAPNTSYTLVRVLTVTSKSDLSIEVQLSNTLAGAVVEQGYSMNPVQTGECSADAGVSTYETHLSGQLIVRPLFEGLSTNFLTFTDNIKVSIPPKGTGLLGIFAEGAAVRGLVVNGQPPVDQWQYVTLTGSCSFNCSAFSFVPGVFQACPTATGMSVPAPVNSYCYCHNFPSWIPPQPGTLCAVCNQFYQNQGTQSLADNCHLLDSGSQYCVQWATTHNPMLLPSGKKRTQYLRRVTGASLSAFARFAEQPEDTDPEKRQLTAFAAEARVFE